MEVVEEDFKNVLKTEHPFSLKFFSCFAKLKLKPSDAFFPSFFHRGKSVIFFFYCCVFVGTMDEVLASLQRGQIQLRKVPAPKTAPPAVDPRSNLMTAIRQGVTLKKVRCWERYHQTASLRYSVLHDNHLMIHHHICLILKTQNILLILIQHPSTSKSWRKSFSPFEIKILRYLCLILLLRYNV